MYFDLIPYTNYVKVQCEDGELLIEDGKLSKDKVDCTVTELDNFLNREVNHPKYVKIMNLLDFNEITSIKYKCRYNESIVLTLKDVNDLPYLPKDSNYLHFTKSSLLSKSFKGMQCYKIIFGKEDFNFNNLPHKFYEGLKYHNIPVSKYLFNTLNNIIGASSLKNLTFLTNLDIKLSIEHFNFDLSVIVYLYLLTKNDFVLYFKANKAGKEVQLKALIYLKLSENEDVEKLSKYIINQLNY